MDNQYEVMCSGFWQLRRTLNLAYSMGYAFPSRKKHTALYLYLFHNCYGIGFNDDKKTIWFINEHSEGYFKEQLSMDEWLRSIHGII
jgi:hypothetical protein